MSAGPDGAALSGMEVTGRRSSLARWAPIVVVTAVVLFTLAQLVPYRVTNPSARDEPAWSNQEARALVVAACFDCHSNQSRAHWYTRLAPLSWWTANHVDEGRSKLNFDEWSSSGNRRGEREDDLTESVRRGSMPPAYYTWFGLHPDARLSPSEKAAVIAELRALENQTTGGG